jgi:hypothetical protein
MNLRSLAMALILAIHPGVFASEGEPTSARIGDVQIEIPPGFDGTRRTSPNPQTELDAYVSAPGLPASMLQLSWVNVPWGKGDISEADRYGGASKILDGFLERFSRNVSNWTRTAGEPVMLGGYKAVRARWSGIYRGAPTSGTMYFMGLGKDAYCFHAFGRADVSNPGLIAATGAVERLQMVKGRSIVLRP